MIFISFLRNKSHQLDKLGYIFWNFHITETIFLVNDLHNRLMQNLHIFIEEMGVSVREFEQSVGWSNGYFGKIAKGSVSFSITKLLAIIATYPQLNIYWLFTGKGSMLWHNSNAIPQRISQTDNILNKLETLSPKHKEVPQFENLKSEISNLIAELNYLRLAVKKENQHLGD